MIGSAAYTRVCTLTHAHAHTHGLSLSAQAAASVFSELIIEALNGLKVGEASERRKWRKRHSYRAHSTMVQKSLKMGHKILH